LGLGAHGSKIAGTQRAVDGQLAPAVHRAAHDIAARGRDRPLRETAAVVALRDTWASLFEVHAEAVTHVAHWARGAIRERDDQSVRWMEPYWRGPPLGDIVELEYRLKS
jgi:hypothetical protein